MGRSLWLLLPLACLTSACLAHQAISIRAPQEADASRRALERGDLRRARQHAEVCLEFAPRHADCLVNLGLVELKEGNIPRARSLFVEALRENQEHAGAYNNLGHLELTVDGDAAKAAQRFERALKVNPDYAEARTNLGIAYAQQGDLDAARHAFEKVLLRKDDAYTHNQLGRVLFQLKELPLAIAHLERAVQLQPADDLHWQMLGSLYTEGARYCDAVEAFRRCREVGPRNATCPSDERIVLEKCALGRAAAMP
jgi:tetratricopeptide (TPR) repeat protein